LPALFDLVAHPLLMGAGARLQQPALAAHAQVAQILLGITEAYADSSDNESARSAVAMQVSLQAEADIGSVVATSMSRGSRSITYAGIRVHPDALLIIQNLNRKYGRTALRSEDWAEVISLRPSSDVVAVFERLATKMVGR
jgi:hypothetical protein